MRYRQLYLLPIVALLLNACSGIDYLFGCPLPEAEPEPAIHRQSTANNVPESGTDAPDTGVAEDPQHLHALADGDSPARDDRSPAGSCSL